MKKIALAISMEAPAMPPKPRIPAINATTRNVTTQLSMTRPRLAVALAMAATAASRIDCRNNPVPGTKVPGRETPKFDDSGGTKSRAGLEIRPAKAPG